MCWGRLPDSFWVGGEEGFWGVTELTLLGLGQVMSIQEIVEVELESRSVWLQSQNYFFLYEKDVICKS